MDNQKKLPSKNIKRSLKGLFVILLFRLIAITPLALNRLMSKILGFFSCLFANKTQKTIQTNLRLCFPNLTVKELKQLTLDNLKQNAKLVFEFPVAWLANETKIKNLITQVNHKNLIDELRINQKPIILAVPHIGNWELLWDWVQLNFESFGMYSPSKLPMMDKMMFQSRQRFGGQAFATDPKGIMSLIRRLKQGGVMMILTDQAPKQGSGTYTPFFGHPAYTMTLLHKMIQKTDAELLFGCCLRNPEDKNFSINLFKSNFDICVESVEEFNIGMNQQIEKIIELAPEQYQWSYKRFKRQADATNFYKK